MQCITEVIKMSISFRVTPEEEVQFRNYAQFKGVSISTLIKEAGSTSSKINLLLDREALS
jgi:hypothetical protein